MTNLLNTPTVSKLCSNSATLHWIFSTAIHVIPVSSHAVPPMPTVVLKHLPPSSLRKTEAPNSPKKKDEQWNLFPKRKRKCAHHLNHQLTLSHQQKRCPMTSLHHKSSLFQKILKPPKARLCVSMSVPLVIHHQSLNGI